MFFWKDDGCESISGGNAWLWAFWRLANEICLGFLNFFRIFFFGGFWKPVPKIRNRIQKFTIGSKKVGRQWYSFSFLLYWKDDGCESIPGGNTWLRALWWLAHGGVSNWQFQIHIMHRLDTDYLHTNSIQCWKNKINQKLQNWTISIFCEGRNLCFGANFDVAISVLDVLKKGSLSSNRNGGIKNFCSKNKSADLHKKSKSSNFVIFGRFWIFVLYFMHRLRAVPGGVPRAVENIWGIYWAFLHH